MTQAPEDVVRSLLKALEAGERGLATQLFSPEASYHVSAWADPVVGRAAIAAELDRQATIFADLRCEILTIASTGQTVLMERLDRFTIGGRPIQLHWASAADVDADGLITGLRDYYDMKELEAQLAS